MVVAVKPKKKPADLKASFQTPESDKVKSPPSTKGSLPFKRQQTLAPGKSPSSNKGQLSFKRQKTIIQGKSAPPNKEQLPLKR